MAVSLATDIVLDVIKAAEPTAAEAAYARLQKMAAAGPASEPFTSHLPANEPAGAAQAADAEPYRKFESLVLGSFIQTMLPEETDSVYGGGLSGDMWKSILAQHLGDAVAERGGIGIANRLLADHYREGKAVVPLVGANDGLAGKQLAESTALSTALVQELQRQTTQTLFSDESGATARSSDR
ncbi:MAG: rod-binding protein [Rhizobiaceae bacterium]|nr:rod-binding protein [Rhizobiaceae bacterium]